MKKNFVVVIVIAFLLSPIACSKQGEQGAANNLLSSQSPASSFLTPSSPLTAPGNFAPKFGKVESFVTQGIVADVDGKQLNAEELEKRVAAILAKTPAQNQRQDQEQKEKIKENVVNDFITRALLEKEIQRKKITVNTNDVDKEIDRIKANLPPRMKLDDLLRQRGVEYQKFRKEIIFGLKIDKLVKDYRRVTVTNGEVEKFYEQNKNKFLAPELARIRHIFIAVPSTASTEQKKAKRALADDVRKQIVNGADFAEMARNFSDSPSKNNGGDLGYMLRERLENGIAKAAFDNKIKAISKVVETPEGYHIIQTLDKRSPQIRPLDKQLRSMIGAFIHQQKQNDNFHKMIKEIKSGSQIKINRR